MSLVALLSVWAISAFTAAQAEAAMECGVFLPPVASMDVTASAFSSPEAASGDLATIDSMLQQHTRAMSLANLALQNAQDSRVRRIALRIAEGHAGEIQLLRSWRASWYLGATDFEMSPAMSHAVGTPGTECTGQVFDHAFLVNLRLELQAEVDLARSAQSEASHSELRDFGTSLMKVRTGEISSIDELLASH
jgi:uncharacterized protein (DUF305 family)